MRPFESKVLYAGLVTLTVWILLESVLSLVARFFAPSFGHLAAGSDWFWAWLLVLALGCHAARLTFTDPAAGPLVTSNAEPGTRKLRDGFLAFSGLVFILWGMADALALRPREIFEHPTWLLVSPVGHVLGGIALVLWPALGREFEEGAA